MYSTFLLISIHVTSLSFGWASCISVLPVTVMYEHCSGQSHHQRQTWTAVRVISVGRSHIKHHKSLNVWKMDANQVHLKLPGAALVGNDFKLDCCALHGGHSCHTKRENTFVSEAAENFLLCVLQRLRSLRQHGKEMSEQVTAMLYAPRTGGRNLPCSQLPEHCPWRTHQAVMDVVE